MEATQLLLKVEHVRTAARHELECLHRSEPMLILALALLDKHSWIITATGQVSSSWFARVAGDAARSMQHATCNRSLCQLHCAVDA